jgi:putative thioredoxin
MDLAFGRGASKNAAPPISDVVTANFEAEVIRASMDTPIIVDFWAPWCGPCKQLTPILEKAVTAQRGKVRLAKVNIDENPELAQALRVQSIPTVYAFYQGRPVDAFQGALPESQVKQFVDKLGQQAAGDDQGLADALAQAHAFLDAGSLDDAIEIYQAILSEEPETAAAVAGLVRALLAQHKIDEAKAVLAQVPASIAKHADIIAAKAAIELAEQAANAGPLEPLTQAVERDPGDHRARIDLATALYAAGRRKEAIDHLVEAVRRDRTWNEDEARKQLVKYFEAQGATDPLTIAGRRRLSSILFS